MTRRHSPFRRWEYWTGLAAVCALIIGSALVGLTISRYQSRISVLQAHIDTFDARMTDGESAAAQADAPLDDRAAELQAREQAVAAAEQSVAKREQAVAAAEQRVASDSIGEGTWTVGVDVQPGTYRTRKPVGADCYWGLYRSGSNGRDIISNGIPGGGFPTVQLNVGQEFLNNRCGTFVKQ
jgi:hypothetical protein